MHDASYEPFNSPYLDFVEEAVVYTAPEDPGRTVRIYKQGDELRPDVPAAIHDAVYQRNSTCYWLCKGESDFYRHACSRGWMAVTSNLVTRPDLEYDLLEDGIRIVRYLGTPVRVAIPDEIDGVPVTSIGSNAFPTSIEELHVGANVREILGHTTCPRLRKVSFPSGLERLGAGSFSASPFEEMVVIPASVRFIGPSSLGTGRCLFAGVGAEVVLDQIFTNRCFREGVPPFDFAQYDLDLANYLNPKRKFAPVLARIATPYAMTDEARERFASFLLKHMREVLAELERTGDVRVLHLLLEHGEFSDEQLAAMADRLAASGQTACVVELMEARNRLATTSDSPAERFRL